MHCYQYDTYDEALNATTTMNSIHTRENESYILL